jgi:hypothetical protein
MASVSTGAANRRLDMSSAPLVQYGSAPVTQPGFFGYLSSSGQPSFVRFYGSGLTYTGSGAGAELSGGAITAFELDVAPDDVIFAPELSITGLTGMNAAAIDKDHAASIWAELLKGNDVFDLTGLDEDQVGLGLNVVFGDDLASAISADGSVSDRGGRDLIQGGDNDFELIGDAYEVTGAGGAVARYAGRADRISSGGVAAGMTDRSILMAGDARNVGIDGILKGGDDRLGFIGFSGQARVAGDAFQAGSPLVDHDSRVNGGADTIVVRSVGAAAVAVAGDVFELTGFGLINGGDDVIRISGQAGSVAGDLFESTLDVPATVVGGDDRIIGSDANDFLVGDVAHTNLHHITVVGGDDWIAGGRGADRIFGDYATAAQSASSLPAGDGGDDTLAGGPGNDLLLGQLGDDRLFGDAGRDLMDGSLGADLVDGGDGADDLTGSAGADTLRGGSGAARLRGGEGADRLFGGADRDRFIYESVSESGPTNAGRDRIGDFTRGVDLIDLSPIDAIEGGGGDGDDAFTFIGDAAFIQAGQLRAVQLGDDTLVQVNTAGAGGAELSILLLGVTATTITAADFAL